MEGSGGGKTQHRTKCWIFQQATFDDRRLNKLQLWREVACSKFPSNRLTCPPSIKRVNWTSKKWRDFMRKSWNMISKWRMFHPKFAKIPSTAPTPLAPRRRHLSGPVLGSLAWRRTVMRHWAPEDLTIFSWDPWNLGLKNRPNLRPQSDPEIPIDLWLSWICFFGVPKKWNKPRLSDMLWCLDSTKKFWRHVWSIETMVVQPNHEIQRTPVWIFTSVDPTLWMMLFLYTFTKVLKHDSWAESIITMFYENIINTGFIFPGWAPSLLQWLCCCWFFHQLLKQCQATTLDPYDSFQHV